MFLELDQKRQDQMAAVDSNGYTMTYGQLCQFADEWYQKVSHRCVVFLLYDGNDIGAMAAYVACLSKRVVPLLLGASVETGRLKELIETYEPEYIWATKGGAKNLEDQLTDTGFERYQYHLYQTGYAPYEVYEDLSLLLTTSGSTGSPKLVRHRYENLEANARNISTFFHITMEDRPLIDLPIYYTYGLSIVNSHLYSGATVVLTNHSLMSKDFWNYFKEQKATSMTGVPYTFEVLKRLHFFNMDLPSLNMMSQGGGKLYPELQKEFATYMNSIGGKYIPTYGQTEGSARMAYLPPELAIEKCGSIGKAIPNGKLYLKDEKGNVITQPNVQGEMYYEGPNVTLGYAQKKEELLLGDERHGVLPTGDMAYMDEDGYFYITGRIKRFLKLFGYRVSLDECEQLIKQQFHIDCACCGNDEKLKVFLTDPAYAGEVKTYLLATIKIYAHALDVKVIPEIPKNPAGKILYAKLDEM